MRSPCRVDPEGRDTFSSVLFCIKCHLKSLLKKHHGLKWLSLNFKDVKGPWKIDTLDFAYGEYVVPSLMLS